MADSTLRGRARGNPKIQDLLQEANFLNANRSSKTKIVSILESVLDLLKEDGMLSYLQIHPKKVGVHPCNRYGFGLQVNNVHRLGARIVGMGWSWEACSLAIAMRSGGTNKIADFTVNLQAGSKKLGRNNPQEIDFGSLACGHTNQFLVACIDQAPTDEEALQGPDGCISMEKLMKNDKTGKLKEALEKGMKWTIIDSRAEDMYGSALPNLVQRARQAVGQVQNEESLIEMCLEIQGMAAQMQREGQVPDFDVIAEIVGESQVKHPEDIPIACAFVQKFGGGKEGQYIADLAKFVALCVPANRKVEASKLDAFVNLKLEAAELCPEFVIASLKMDFDCPQDKCKNGVCNFLQPSNIGRLAGSQKAAMIEANAHLRTFKKSMSKLKFLGPGDAILHSGIADAVVARIVHMLPLPKKFEGKTVCAALRLIIRELKILCKSNIDNPFDEGESDEEGEQQEGKTEAPEKPSSSTRHLIEYNTAGRAVGTERSTLESQGFVVNANVERIAGGHKKSLNTTLMIIMIMMIMRIITPDGKVLRIMDVLGDGTVKMKEYADDGTLQKKVLSSPFAVFTVKYKSTTKARAIMHDFLEQHIVDKPSFIEIDMESQAQYAVSRFYATSELPAVELQTKPRQGLFAKEAYRKAEFELVVWGKVMRTDTPRKGKGGGKDTATDAVPKRTFEVKGLSPMGKTLYIKPMSKENEVNPLTFVHWVDDEEEVTARIVYRPVTGIFPKSARALSLPVLVNKKSLKVGDEITLLKTWEAETKEPIKRHVAATPAVGSSKRPRTGNANIG